MKTVFVALAAATPMALGGLLIWWRYGSPLPHSVAAKQVAYQPTWPFENAIAMLLQASQDVGRQMPWRLNDEAPIAHEHGRALFSRCQERKNGAHSSTSTTWPSSPSSASPGNADAFGDADACRRVSRDKLT